jgi:hypothetical protein
MARVSRGRETSSLISYLAGDFDNSRAILGEANHDIRGISLQKTAVQDSWS